jgi:hypothetical protein
VHVEIRGGAALGDRAPSSSSTNEVPSRKLVVSNVPWICRHRPRGPPSSIRSRDHLARHGHAVPRRPEQPCPVADREVDRERDVAHAEGIELVEQLLS